MDVSVYTQVNKLVTVFGYPEILRSFTFCWDYMMKGLIIDKVCVCVCLPVKERARMCGW